MQTTDYNWEEFKNLSIPKSRMLLTWNSTRSIRFSHSNSIGEFGSCLILWRRKSAL